MRQLLEDEKTNMIKKCKSLKKRGLDCWFCKVGHLDCMVIHDNHYLFPCRGKVWARHKNEVRDDFVVPDDFEGDGLI